MDIDYDGIAQWLFATPCWCKTSAAAEPAGVRYGTPGVAANHNFRETLDESFADALFRLLAERGLTCPEVYKPVNIKKQTISGLNSGRRSHVDKKTACALAIGLHLEIAEADDLLHKAGYHLSDSLLDDVIVKFFLRNHKYNINDINGLMFEQTGKTLTEYKNMKN